MDQFDLTLYIAIVPSLLCLAVAFKLFFVIKENRLLADQLTETTVSLAELKNTMSQLQGRHERLHDFQNNLLTAEITTRLQKPRLENNNRSSVSTIPEKYSFIHTLIEKNMPAPDIASVLSISVTEAEQLVALSKLAGKQ